MEPIHLRSSIAQSQEVSRLQRVAEDFQDQSRQALVRELYEDRRKQKIDPSEGVEATQVNPDRRQPGRDGGRRDKRTRASTDEDAPDKGRGAHDAPDGTKGRVLDIRI